MSKCPHLHRRGNVLYFRLSVPPRFRSILKVSELTASLHTQERKNAIPAAYKLAGEAKTLFLYLDGAMTDKNEYDDECDFDLLKAVCDQLERDEKKEIASLPPLARRIIAERDNSVAAAKRREDQAVLHVKADAFDKLQPVAMIAPASHQESIDTLSRHYPKKRSKSPRLSVVRESQIDNLDKSTHAANKKTDANKWWDVFIELTGDKQIDELEQIDIDYYLEEVCYLPSNNNAPEYKNLSYKEKIKLCKKNKSESISKKTFANNYKAQIKKFVEHGYKEFKSSGFKKITVNDSNKYDGNQVAGKSEQRPMLLLEVDRLINNDVMRGHIDSVDTVHNYWFVMLGLFSGARLNEVCQLHPLKDIRKDEKMGVWLLEVTEDEDREAIKEGGVNQFAKSDAAKREVPIHQKLIDLGFIDYVLKRRDEGAAIIFPFMPRKDGDVMRAGSNAGQEFTKYLKKIGLHDSTAKNKVAGFHSLRKTFITEASDCVGKTMFKGEDDELDRLMLSFGKIAPIVGHETSMRNKAGENVSMTAFYAKRKVKELKRAGIDKKKVIIDCLDYGVNFPKPK